MKPAKQREPLRPRRRGDRRELTAPTADQRAGAVRGEELEQHRVRRAAVEDHRRPHAAVDGVERGPVFGIMPPEIVPAAVNARTSAGVSW